MRIASVSIALLLSSCASTPPPAPPAPAPEAPSATVLWSVPVSWEAGIPVINAKVRTGDTKFAIATSSSNHLLTKTFASAVRAPVSTTRQTSSVYGAEAEVEKVEGVVSIKSADAEWRLEQVVATDAAPLDARGIGGMIVPQALVSNTTTVVIDLKGGALTLVEGDAKLFSDWFESKYGASDKLPLTRRDGLIYVDGTIGEGAATSMRLATAIPKSRFAASAVSATVASDACVEGADLMVDCSPGAAAQVKGLKMGPVSFPAWEAMAISAGDAVVGADVLKQCVVALSVGNEAHIVCPGS